MHRVVVFKAMKLDELTEEMSVSREEFCELTLILECSEKKKQSKGKKRHHVEKVMAPHSSTLAWKSPWMEEPGRLQSMGLLRVGHD